MSYAILSQFEGLLYLCWGGDGEAAQLEKYNGAENCLGCAQNTQHLMHALSAGILLRKTRNLTTRTVVNLKGLFSLFPLATNSSFFLDLTHLRLNIMIGGCQDTPFAIMLK